MLLLSRELLNNLTVLDAVCHQIYNKHNQILIKNETAKYVVPNTALFLTIVRASVLLTNQRAEQMSTANCNVGSAIGNLCPKPHV